MYWTKRTVLAIAAGAGLWLFAAAPSSAAPMGQAAGAATEKAVAQSEGYIIAVRRGWAGHRGGFRGHHMGGHRFGGFGGRRFHGSHMGGRRFYGGHFRGRHFYGGGGRRFYGGYWRGHRHGHWRGHRHHRRFYGGFYGWGFPYYYGDYGYGYYGNSCYRTCRLYHGPRYCRYHWRRYCY
jgi:hypothetical protein